LITSWTDTARKQLLDLDEYLSEKNLGAAERIVDRILAASLSLETFPMAGRPGRVAGTRELTVPRTKYLIAYRTVRTSVQILAILHGAQRWPRGFAR